MRDRRTLARLAITVLIVVSHALLFRLLSGSSRAPSEPPAHDVVTAYLVLPASETVRAIARVRSTPRITSGASGASGKVPALRAHSRSPRPTERGAAAALAARPTMRQPAGAAPVRAASIDWEKEGERAAQHELAAEERSRQLASALNSRTGAAPSSPNPPRRAEFGWAHSRIHRIEQRRGVGILVWLNDRCALLITGMAIVGGCALGRIEPRGDLFAHLKEPSGSTAPALP